MKTETFYIGGQKVKVTALESRFETVKANVIHDMTNESGSLFQSFTREKQLTIKYGKP